MADGGERRGIGWKENSESPGHLSLPETVQIWMKIEDIVLGFTHPRTAQVSNTAVLLK